MEWCVARQMFALADIHWKTNAADSARWLNVRLGEQCCWLPCGTAPGSLPGNVNVMWSRCARLIWPHLGCGWCRDRAASASLSSTVGGLEPGSSVAYGAPMGIDVTQPGYHRGRTPANKGRTYPDEVRALLLQCSENSSLGVRHRALIAMLYRTGRRCSEALALRIKDVDVRVGSVAVLHGKGDRLRTVGIDPGANPHIEAWIESRRTLDLPADAPLFCTMKGTPMPSSNVRGLFAKLAFRAGIEKRVHPHGFRHTHGYELMMEGVPMPIIQRQLGHVSQVTTDRYLSHIAPKQVIETMGKREWSP
jgi:hypothetical protein